MPISLIAALLALVALPVVYYLSQKYYGEERRRAELAAFFIDPSIAEMIVGLRRERGSDPMTQRQATDLVYEAYTRRLNQPDRQRPLLGALSDPAVIMQIALSFIVIGAALYMILSGRYDNSNQHWAFGIVGTVVGFWLKGAK